MPRPQLNRLDTFIAGCDQALRIVLGSEPAVARRPYPAGEGSLETLNPESRRASGRLMRVNHTGEVCAQALYLGQASAALRPAHREVLNQAADEEVDHLVWCAQRLRELESRPSRLNPVWFGGSFTIGLVAGLCGERVSLGFLAETERQVEAHLAAHLDALPREDETSRRILNQMRRDEARHAATARAQGAIELPAAVRWLMKLQARIMTTIAARL